MYTKLSSPLLHVDNSNVRLSYLYNLMLLSTKIMLLSHTSCYYQQKSCYYQTPHAIIHKTYVIIVQLVILSDTSTTHVIKHIIFIIRYLMLLSDTSFYYQTTHVITNTLTYYPYTSYHTIIHQCSPHSSWCETSHLTSLACHFS